nr:hypothetical protein Iba_chr03cCG7260 [Ipomoea batatas]
MSVRSYIRECKSGRSKSYAHSNLSIQTVSPETDGEIGFAYGIFLLGLTNFYGNAKLVYENLIHRRVFFQAKGVSLANMGETTIATIRKLCVQDQTFKNAVTPYKLIAAEWIIPECLLSFKSQLLLSTTARDGNFLHIADLLTWIYVPEKLILYPDKSSHSYLSRVEFEWSGTRFELFAAVVARLRLVSRLSRVEFEWFGTRFEFFAAVVARLRLVSRLSRVEFEWFGTRFELFGAVVARL